MKTETDLPMSESSAIAPTAVSRRLHSGVSVSRYHAMHFVGMLFPLAAGVILFGWRAAIVVFGVMGSAAAALYFWRRIGTRGGHLHLVHALWLAMLLALMLPAQLATTLHGPNGSSPAWPLIGIAGILLVLVLWLVGGLATAPIHPSVVTFLFLLALFGPYLEPDWVLSRDYIVTGDVLHGTPGTGGVSPDSWLKRSAAANHESLWGEPPSRALTEFTTGRLRPTRGQVAIHALLRDRMPPLEDLIIGGHAAPIGLGSAIAIIVGGLFLVYRGLIDFRIPLLVILFAFGALLVLPVPTVIRDQTTHLRWLAMRQPGIRWETALTFVSYELMAGPTLFVAFFLATAAPVRPLSRRSRTIYATVLGVSCAAGQLYLSAAYGPYFAVLLAGLISPLLDRIFTPRALI